jgi:hypothetical protein
VVKRLRYPSAVLALMALAGVVIHNTMLAEPLVSAANLSRRVAPQPVVERCGGSDTEVPLHWVLGIQDTKAPDNRRIYLWIV